MTGPKFLTLRDEFVINSYKYRNRLEKILLLFGGSDQANFSTKVLANLLSSGNQFEYTVILGKGFCFRSLLDNLMMEYPDSAVKIVSDVNNVYEYLIDNDFLITSAGTALFEGFYVGIPTVGFYQTPSQEEIFNGFYRTYNFNSVSNMADFILQLYDDDNFYRKKLVELEVGFGKQDIIDNIKNLFK